MFGSTMGLSYFSPWDAIQFQDSVTPETDMFFQQSQNQVQQEELLPEILTADMFDFDFTDHFLQPLNEPESISHFPKRQKLQTSDFNPGFNRDLFQMNPPAPENVFLSENPILPDFWMPEFSVGLGSGRNADQMNLSDEKKPSLSAQSVAARQRRRKIAEKTQELAKLIPGGQRMNTAEMFQTAAKYVKFLQAQVGILQLIASLEDLKEATNEKEEEEEVDLGFLASPAIQEKLASEEKCLVPRKFVEAFAADQTNTKISDYVNKLLLTNGGRTES